MGTSTLLEYQDESSTNTFGGQAVVANCALCSGGAKAGYIGGTGTNNGTLTFNSVNVPTAGTYPLTISYAEGGTANRSATITVNGTAVTTPSFIPTGEYPRVLGRLRPGQQRQPRHHGHQHPVDQRHDHEH